MTARTAVADKGSRCVGPSCVQRGELNQRLHEAVGESAPAIGTQARARGRLSVCVRVRARF